MITEKKQPEKKGKAMHDIDLLARCSRHYCEVLPDDIGIAECLVEDLFGRVLSQFFEVVLIGDVSLSFAPARDAQASPIAITLRAQGYDPLFVQNGDYLSDAIQEQLSGALSELLGSFCVERFSMSELTLPQQSYKCG
jgi:hypothetical protein